MGRAWGTPAEIAAGVGPVARRLLLEVEGWSEETGRRVRTLPSVQSVYAEPADGPRVSVQLGIGSWDGARTVLDIVQTVTSCGGRIESLRDEPPSLTELFLRVTGAKTPGCGSPTAPGPVPS